jgi:dienelactone hydrolase
MADAGVSDYLWIMLRLICLTVVALLALIQPGFALPPGVRALDTSVAAADGRTVPLRALLPPASRRAAPVILFSHGAFSSNAKYDVLLGRWAAAGYLVVAPTHPDNDKANRRTLVPDVVFAARLADMAAALTWALAPIEAAPGLKADPSRIVAAGHSYGAVTAQAMGGAVVHAIAGGTPFPSRDPRVKAVIGFSPPGPLPPFIRAEAWTTLAVPSFVQTGTGDILPGFIDRWELHRVAFDTAPANGTNWLVTGTGVDHYFGGIIGRFEVPGPRQEAQFAASVDLSIRFLEASLRPAPNKALRALERTRATFKPGPVLHQLERR